MFGKFFLLAVVCVSLVQVRGDELENAIKKGLLRAQSLNRQGQKRIDATINEVSFKRKLIESKTADFISRAEKIQDTTEQALGNVAETMREKARESKKPQSVFECINRVEENANENVESLTKKFESDMERLEKVKLGNIETYAKPLDEMTEALKVRYERAVSIIKECKTPQSVEIANNSFLNWLNMLTSEMSRIRSQINVAVTNFQRDATTFSNNTNRQVSRIKSAAMRNIRLCIFNRDAFSEEY